MQLKPELVADVRRTRLLAAVVTVLCPMAVGFTFALWVRATHRLAGREAPPYLSWMPVAPFLIMLYLIEEGSAEGFLLFGGALSIRACGESLFGVLTTR